MQFNEEEYELSKPDVEGVVEIFKELEFRRLTDQFIKMFNEGGESGGGLTTPAATSEKKKREISHKQQFSLFGNDTSKEDVSAENFTGYQNLENTSHLYQLIEPGMATQLFLKKLNTQTSVCFDTETTSLDTFNAELVGIAFSWEKGKGYYLPIPEDQEEAKSILEPLKEFFSNPKIQKIGQNLKYDIKVFTLQK